MSDRVTVEPSIVKRGERTFDDLKDLWRRRKFLFVLIAIIICTPSILLFFDHFWGRSKLVEELNDTRRDRDAKATQLAPFLALANSRYENAPEGKRLDLLVDRLEAATQTLVQIAKPTEKRRELSSDGIKRIQEKLDFAKRVPVSITSANGADVGSIPKQLKQLFEGSGFTVNGINLGFFTEVPEGLIVQAKPPLQPELEDALLIMFKDLGEEPKFYRAESGSESELSIIVGSKPQK